MIKTYLTDYFGSVNFCIVRTFVKNKLHIGIHHDFETACNVANKMDAELYVNNFSFFDEFGNLYTRGIQVKDKDIKVFKTENDNWEHHYLKSDIYETPVYGFEVHEPIEKNIPYTFRELFKGIRHNVLVFNKYNYVKFYLPELNTETVCNNSFKNYTITFSKVAQDEELEHNMFKQRDEYALTEVGSALSPDREFILNLRGNGKFK